MEGITNISFQNILHLIRAILLGDKTMCDYCETKLHSDGQPLLSIGRWAENKLHYLDYYASLFTSGMKNRWRDIAYIDLFSGPGLCVVRNKENNIVKGSPLIALSLKNAFSHYVFVDSDENHVKALNSRMLDFATSSQKKVLLGDCNDTRVIKQITNFIPEDALCLAFVDPFKCDIAFKTIQTLTESRKVDIILTFQIAGMQRGAGYAPTSLNRFFGDNGEWNQIYTSTPKGRRVRALLDYYKNQLSTLDYLDDYYPSEVAVLNSRNRAIYYMVFASKHPRGQDFWQKAIQKSATGARKLPGF